MNLVVIKKVSSVTTVTAVMMIRSGDLTMFVFWECGLRYLILSGLGWRVVVGVGLCGLVSGA